MQEERRMSDHKKELLIQLSPIVINRMGIIAKIYKKSISTYIEEVLEENILFFENSFDYYNNSDLTWKKEE